MSSTRSWARAWLSRPTSGISLVGIELLTIDASVVIASVDTYLRFAEAANRPVISQDKEELIELVGGGHSQRGG
jgi:hypothetical protein